MRTEAKALVLVAAMAALFALPQSALAQAASKAPGAIRRLANGKPDMTGYYNADTFGANVTANLGRLVIDPPDGKLPYQDWARTEQADRSLPHRGYDDPTAHCFPAGVPRGLYVPSPYQILQPPGYFLMLFERMSWRIVSINNGPHIPDNIRLWQGDSIAQWDGDTLVVDSTNFNGKTWLNEAGDFISHAVHVVERFTPKDSETITYTATVTDPVVFTRPWTIQMKLTRQEDELLEIACHEDDQDLPHLKDVRDAYRAEHKK